MYGTSNTRYSRSGKSHVTGNARTYHFPYIFISHMVIDVTVAVWLDAYCARGVFDPIARLPLRSNLYGCFASHTSVPKTPNIIEPRSVQSMIPDTFSIKIIKVPGSHPCSLGSNLISPNFAPKHIPKPKDTSPECDFDHRTGN
jgi:hypothetical protein